MGPWTWSDAWEEYSSIMSKTHVNFKVDLCGLVINPKYQYMAGSPVGNVVIHAMVHT